MSLGHAEPWDQAETKGNLWQRKLGQMGYKVMYTSYLIRLSDRCCQH